jgi:hypothetical protein
MMSDDGKTYFENAEQLPPDFKEIDADPDHWCLIEYTGQSWVVPNTDALNDSTEAMMSEIPGQDDTVTPLKLHDQRFYKFCMAYLMQDGNLAVPGGRYGSDSETCAEVAILMALVMRYHNGEPISYYSLNSDMGSVVNSADGVSELLSESQYILDDWNVNVKELLGDEYTPQTPLERLARWADVDTDNDNTVTITFDESDVEKLIDAILDREAPFDSHE